jgi:site-specific DNA-methyltransferase (adenine-specific)
MLEMNNLYLMDCMDGMRQFPDKHFDLAIVDPPYRDENTPTGHMRKLGQMKQFGKRPGAEYFKELFRVSKNQIIWGANNFIENLISTDNFIFWYKRNPLESYSDGELAWTSFKGTARCLDLPHFGAHGTDKDRIHPTQKPVKLYDWLLSKYAKPGDKILDTHTGSASSLIACHQAGFEFIGFEIDADYHEKATARLDAARAQIQFDF